MSERKGKPCVRCRKGIDAYARLCPYCNWDQSEPAPPPELVAAEAAPAALPQAESRWRKPLLYVAGAVMLVVVSFGVGTLVLDDGPPDPDQEAERPAAVAGKPAPRSSVELIPINGPMPGEAPITSAPAIEPAQGMPPDAYQRHDATAVGSEEYQALLRKAQAEKKLQTLVDPRAISGPAYGTPAPRRRPPPTMPPPMTSASGTTNVIRTRARAEHQPLPHISVSHPTTAKLELTVGADGTVKEVNIRQPLPGDTPRLIAAVQRWRFRPATENGQPVQSTVSVDISFNPND